MITRINGTSTVQSNDFCLNFFTKESVSTPNGTAQILASRNKENLLMQAYCQKTGRVPSCLVHKEAHCFNVAVLDEQFGMDEPALFVALAEIKEEMENSGISKLFVPELGNYDLEKALTEVFYDTNFEIFVCCKEDVGMTAYEGALGKFSYDESVWGINKVPEFLHCKTGMGALPDGFSKKCLDNLFLDRTDLEECKGEFIDRTTESIDSILAGCSSVKSVSLGEDYSSIQNASAAFAGCQSLVINPLEGKSLASLKKMDLIFRDCSSLREVVLEGLDSLESMDEAFAGCSNLEKVVLKGKCSIKSMNNAFAGCSKLKCVDLTECYIENGAGLDSVFDGCPVGTTVSNSFLKKEYNKRKGLDSMSIFG